MKKTEISEIRDLAEFCEEWPILRERVSGKSLAELTDDDETRTIIWWLANLADKVCMDFDEKNGLY
ncbi:MAG: hypothetical protein R3C97_09505 [Geminicoccaceae bacterium]